MKTLVNLLTVYLSLFTATGVFIHDGRIDRAVTSTAQPGQAIHAKKLPNKNPVPDSGPDPHTHPTHASAGLKGFSQKTNPNPSYPPRDAQKMKKYLQQNIEPRGRHAFDNYNLPVVE